MAGRRYRIGSIIFALAWLAVVGAAVALAVVRRESQGVYTYIIIGMAAMMLVVFVINYLPWRLQAKSATEVIGKLSTGLLILSVIILLAVSLAKGYRNLGLFGSAVLLLFLVTFIRIFASYLKDMGIRLRHEPKGDRKDSQ
ncbi:MAG: hypothetical protein HY801_14455 [Candidatus Lindowbacteria bacterium]|nr:hypothetical protein [Candidatus Lindowbacteria bacterium]